jgi:hypothetical protein
MKDYLTSSFMGTLQGGGLGNQLFEFISTYAIARQLGRQPFIRIDQHVLYKKFQLLTYLFPNLFDYYTIMDQMPKKCIKTVKFGNNYAVYDNIEKLDKYKNNYNYLKLSGSLLQR